MLPPVLEIYVVWHPSDARGRVAADQFLEHFHGTPFSGLIGGAVEVYCRSEGWTGQGDAPRPIPLPTAPPPNGVAQAQLTAIVPVLGTELAFAVEPQAGAWFEYVRSIAQAQAAAPDRVGVFPLLINPGADHGTVLGDIFSRFQRIAVVDHGLQEPENELRCRDLAQGIAQLAADGRLTVFISHTKRADSSEGASIRELIATVRSIIGETRLADFFDANDLQPGEDWDRQLRSAAATGALLAVRTDLYSSRAWCQLEMLIAKRSGMPIVILDALRDGEARGSFLMDHVPRVPAHMDGSGWQRSDVRRALNLLVDECLKRALWHRQAELATRTTAFDIAWWAPHAPEALTLSQWLQEQTSAGRPLAGTTIRILHPDPPLGPEEKAVLDQIAGLSGVDTKLDMMTPRLLAVRGG